MSEIHKSKVSLGIYGDKLDPSELTKLLNCTPTVQAKKGDLRPGENLDGSKRIMPIGRWILDNELPDTTEIAIKIGHLLTKVTADISIWQMINQKFSSRIFCGIFMDSRNEGFGLSVALLKSLSERGLKIEFDLYNDYLELGEQQC